MNPFVATLAAEHLQDLLREAEHERLWKLARTGSPAATRNASLGRRLESALRRLRGLLPGARRARPATT